MTGKQSTQAKIPDKIPINVQGEEYVDAFFTMLPTNPKSRPLIVLVSLYVCFL
jgi:hypothetical protein